MQPYKIKRRFESVGIDTAPAPQRQYLDRLDEDQRQAVLHRGTNLLIVAGAGSGKTRTLTYRAASLLEAIPPENMIVMTFTNKAADEIHQRIRNSVVKVDLKRLWIGTFHSVCRRILLESGQKVGLLDNWSILDADDSDRVIRMGSVPPHVDASEVLRLYSYARNSMTDWRTLVGSQRFSNLTDEVAIGKIIHHYARRCQRNSRVDFDDLLVLTRKLLEDFPEVRRAYQDRFRAVFIDEYQDTNRLQARICELLATENNITVVGDDSQAIYGFRAATLDNILEFTQRFAPATKIDLRTNYRSTPEIVHLSNESIKHNRKRFEKVIRASKKSSGKRPWLVHAESMRDEATFVIERIWELVVDRQEVSLNDIAVLFRARQQVAELQLQLRQLDIPFRIVGTQDFFALSHIKIVLDFARLLLNPEDTIALNAIRDLTEYAPPHVLTEVEQFIEQQRDQVSLWDTAFLHFEKASGKEEKAWASLLEFGEKLADLQETAIEGERITGTIARIVKEITPYLRQKHGPAWEEIAQDLQVLVDISSHYTSLQDFVDVVALEPFEIEKKQTHPQFGEDCLTLTTIHSAKGLEWNTVFIIGMVEFWFPMNLAIRAEGSDEEERRLFYVAVTRAKEDLYLVHHSKAFDRYGRLHPQNLSRFVQELPPSVYESIVVEMT